MDLNEEKERKQIWIIRWQSGRIRSEYGTYEEAKQVAEEIGGDSVHFGTVADSGSGCSSMHSDDDRSGNIVDRNDTRYFGD